MVQSIYILKEYMYPHLNSKFQKFPDDVIMWRHHLTQLHVGFFDPWFQLGGQFTRPLCKLSNTCGMKMGFCMLIKEYYKICFQYLLLPWRHYFWWRQHFRLWRHHMEKYRKIRWGLVNWRHEARSSPNYQQMFLLLTLCYGPNMKSFASFKRKLWVI